MSRNAWKRRTAATRVFAGIFTMTCVIGLWPGMSSMPVRGETLADRLQQDGKETVSYEYEETNTYRETLREYERAGYKPAKIEEPLSISAAAYTKAAKEPKILPDHNGESSVVLWEEDNEYIEWTIQVPNDGLYAMKLTYCAYNDNATPILRTISINGKIPFTEAAGLSLKRRFEQSGEVKVNGAGDQVRPLVRQQLIWQTASFFDETRAYELPLQFHLQAGSNVIRMSMVDEPVVLKNILLYAVEAPADYATYKKSISDKGYQPAEKPIYLEAEKDVSYTNSSTLRSQSDFDPLAKPHKAGYVTMNTLGGTGWQAGGDSATWKFMVEKAGVYKLALRVRQDYREGLPSYRRIELDERVPFTEFSNYRFLYQDGWRTEVLADEENNAYEVFLDAGEHTLSMTVSQGDIGEVHALLMADSLRLSALVRKITMITGQMPDYNFNYELDKNVPDLISTLESLRDNMKSMMTVLDRISGTRPSMYYQLESMRDLLDGMIANPYYIPRRLNNLNTIMTTYGTWLSSFQAHPLLLDYIEIVPADAAVENPQSGFFANLGVSALNFLNSFLKDYDSITSTVTESGDQQTVLDVWIGRGKDWGSLIKQMTDERFTPKEGIGVRINVLPAGQLNAGSVNAMLLAIASGRAPDLGLGTPTGSIGEFSIRNAVLDISQFDDFKDVSTQFYKEMLIPLTYNRQVFGLPETTNFRVMIYRKDILSDLKLGLPESWDELRDKVIPVLNQNNMQFYMAGGDVSYDMFLYQLGGEYYSEDQLACALDTPQAYLAFKEMCEMFTMYGVPVTANFFNRIRNGEMPMGIVDYTTYMQVMEAAPELKGRLGVALIPGHVKADGSLDRTHTGITGESAMIMSQSQKTDEAWKFLKWWVSEEVQSEFASEIEVSMGSAARWNTANVKAFHNLPWSREDMAVIEKSYEQISQIPVVLGGYFTSRHLNNAFNRVVISKQNPRDSLEKAVLDINRELARRRESSKK